MDKSEAIVSVDDAIRKLVQLSSKEKVWTQEMLLQVSDQSLRLLDVESQVGSGAGGRGIDQSSGASLSGWGPDKRQGQTGQGRWLDGAECSQKPRHTGPGVSVIRVPWLWPVSGANVCPRWATSLFWAASCTCVHVRGWDATGRVRGCVPPRLCLGRVCIH